MTCAEARTGRDIDGVPPLMSVSPTDDPLDDNCGPIPHQNDAKGGEVKFQKKSGSGLPTLSRRSRSYMSVASSVPSVLAPMPGIRRNGSVLEPKGLLENHYTMSRPLGQGSFGVVCAVRHRESAQLRALKSIPFDKLENPEDFKDELAIARKLDHPYIVRLHEVFLTNECVQLVMELCGAGTLAEMLAKAQKAASLSGPGAVARFPVMLTGCFMWQMLCGIAYLHHHRIIHRDIKPDNYLVVLGKDSELSLKLADFGLACRYRKGKPLKDILGTPSYVAPEVLSGCYNEKCDVWSIGVVSFVLCVGWHPFHQGAGETAQVIMQRIWDGTMCGDEGASGHRTNLESRELVERMMTRDHMLRPSAKQLIAESPWLRRFKKGEATSQPCSQGCCVVS